MYLEGKATEKDGNEAIRWIEKSTEAMDPDECFKQGIYFFNDKNYRISLRYMKAAAEGNNGDTQAYLSLMYFGGLGVKKSHKQAMKWFQKSTMQLNSLGCHEKGMEFYESVDLDNNYEIALLYLKKAAGEDDSKAQVQLGIMYLHGVGLERNDYKAMEWIESSIKKYMNGYYSFNFGLIFYNGIKVEKNYDIALKFLQKSADDNYELAQALLGLMYLDGHGVSKNEDKAKSWIENSMRKKEPNDCNDQAMKYYNGFDIEKNHKIAMLYLQMAEHKNILRPKSKSALCISKVMVLKKAK
jgi:TPR repeat protein